MSQHRIRGWFGMLAIAVLAVAFLFPGVAQAAVGGTVTGTVVDESATGITGIMVVPLTMIDGRWVEHWDGLQVETTTGGAYELTLPIGEYRFRFIDTQGLVTPTPGEKYYAYEYYPDANWVDEGTSLVVELDGSYSLGETVLVEGATISGTVTADDGGDTLLGIHAVAHVRFGGGFPGVKEGLTDESGNYTIPGLPPGEYAVRFWDPDNGAYASEFYNDQPDWRIDLADKFLIGGPTTSLTGIDAQLATACSISGVVTDGGIAALNGAIVRLSAFDPDGGNWMWAAETRTSGDTGTDGWYSLSGLRAGVYRLMVEGPDASYASECYNDKPPLPIMGDDIVVGGAMPADATADVALAAAGYITGHVRQEGSGNPIADLPVNACIERDGWYEAVAWASTDSNGLYTVGHMASGTYYVQFIGANGWVGEIYNDQRDWWSADGVPVMAGLYTTLDDAYLTAGATVEGYLYAPDGTTPLSGIAVTPVRRVDYGDGNIGHEERGDLTYYTDVDPLGHFRIEGLEPGDWALRIYDASGMYAAQFQDGELIPSNAFFRTIASGETWSVPNIVLSEAGTVNGTVYDDGEPGTPLEGITVAAWIPIGGGYEWIVSDQTDSAGYYEILGVMPGEVYLEFQGTTQWLGEYWSDDPVGGTRDRMLADPVTVTAGLTASFDAHLEAAAVVAGHVTTDGGTTDLANISVVPMQLEDDGYSTWWNHRWDLQDQTDEAGLFEVGGLTPGTWSLMYTDPNGIYATEYWNERSLQSQVDMFNITGGGLQPGSYDADLEPGCTISGVVYGATEPEPTALANMGVSANVDRGDWYESVAWTNTGPDGSYTLTGMQAGTYLVEFYGDLEWMGQFYSDSYPGTRDWMQATGLAITPDEPASGIDAMLQAAAQITGHVSTNDGDVIADAEGIQVIPLQYNEGSQRWEYQWHLGVMTDAVGDYTIGGLDFTDFKIVFQDPNGQWAAEFYHDTSSPLDAWLVGITTDTWVANEELVPGNTITGTVTGYVAASDSVEPLGGIGIAAGPYDDEGYYEHITWANTGVDGTFELRGLPAGSFKVQFWDDAGTYVGEFYDDTTDWSLATPVDFAGTGQSQDLGTIELGVAASLSGHVTNGADDLAGIDVRPMYWRDDGDGGGWWEERWDLNRQTDETGTFTLTGLTPSEVPDTVIVFEDPSGMYAKEYYDDASTPGAALRLQLDPGPNALPDVVLEQANHISGTVTSDGTTGIGGITVAAGPYDPGTGQYEHIAWATTSAEEGFEGTYDLGGLPPGSYVVQFWDDSFGYIEQFYSITEPGTRDIQQATPVVFAGSGETQSGIDAQMAAGATVSGTVTEPDGTSGIGEIEVVPVFWQDDGGGGGWWDAQWHRSTRTGPDGGFTLGVFEPGETFRLLFQDPSGAWAYEYYDDALTVDAGADVGPLTAGDNPVGVIMLDPANHIQGTVDSADGPLGGMTVAAGIYDRDTGYYEHVSWTMTSSEPGAEGTYDLGGLPPGSYIVQFWDDAGNHGMKFYDGTSQGTTDWEASLPVDFSGNGGTVTGVDVYLDPAATLSGIVYGDDGSGPQELAGIDVELYTYNGEWWDYSGWTQTGEDGTYRFGGLVDGSLCRVWFSDWTGTWAAQAYMDASSWMWGDELTASIDTPADGIDAILSPAGSITGVVSGDGVPLAGAPVSAGAYDEATDQWDQHFFAETDDEGRYTISGLKPGVAYLVQAGDYSGTYVWTMWTADGTGTGDWHTGDDVFVLPPPEEPTVCDFDLSTGGSITGHVENALGQSLEGVDVMLFAPTEAGWDDWWGSFQGVQGSTDENGDYRVGGLYPGDYRILFVPAEGSGYANEYYNDQPALSIGTTITVTTLGGQVAVDTAVLSEAATIEGHVYDDGDPGTPIEGIEVRAAVATGGENDWRDIERSVMTDESGYYRIDGLRPEDDLYIFAADFMGGHLEEWWQEAPGFAEATPVNAPQSGIDFTLAQGGRITGTITLDPSGTYENIGVTIYRPVGEGVDWHLEPVDWIHGGWGGIDEAGGFSSGPLPPGTYYVAFYDDSGTYASEYYDDALLPTEAMMVNVVPGGSEVANATLTEAARVSGLVADSEDAPLAGIEVRALIWDELGERWEPAGTQFGTTDETGGYFLPVPTGVIFIIEFSDPTGVYAVQYYDGVNSPIDANQYSMLAGNSFTGADAVMTPADSEAPTIEISVDPATPDGENGWYVAAPAITLTTDDPTATMWYQWGSDAPAEYTEPIEPPAGTATLTFWASDPVGNESEHGTQDFKYDPLPPNAPLTMSILQTGAAQVTATWGASLDEDSGLSHYELWISSDSTTWDLAADDIVSESYLLEDLASGDLYVRVAAVDLAGNTSLYSPSDFVVVDADAPETTAIVAPVAPDGTNGWYVTAPTITLSADDPGATTWYRWGTDAFAEYATPLSADEGSSTLAYYSEDEWNAETPAKTLSFKVDTIGPDQVTGLSAIAVSESAIDLEWTATTDGTSGVAGYRIYQDGSFVTTVTATAYQVTGLAPDTLYSFTVSAYDEAGNEGPESASADEATLADTTSPTTAIQVTGGTLGQNGWYTAPPSITLTPDEPATTWYQWGTDEPLEYTDSFQPPVGENVLTYWSADASENTETPKPTQTFKLDETAPSMPGTFTAERSGPSAVTLTWSASSDAESGIASYTYVQTGPQSGSGLIGAALTSDTINSLPDGTYTFKLMARNGAGLTSAYTETITVVIDTVAPTTTASTTPAAPDGTNGWFKTVPTITLGSTATDLDWIVYRWGEGVTTTYTVGFQPPAQGTNTLWWHGADEYGNVEAWKSRAFKLDSVAPAAPEGVGGMALGQTTASFWWSAVTGDTSGIARYRVYRDGSVADEVLGTSFDAAGLTPGTTYVFTVRAIDNAGNEGTLSEPVSVTTEAPTLYTVTFRDWDGTVLKSEEVPEGGAATAPAQPTRADYTFAGWDVDFGVITSDLTVTATYTYNGVVWETIGGVDYARVAGALRFDTAAQSALDAFPVGAATAVIAYGRDFPDALAASPLAGAVSGPILLTETATLPQVTADALTDLGVTKVYIVGGTGVVSPAVEAAIRALGVSEIERLSGANRYITARKIADEAVALGASTTEAFLVRGDDFADALAVSSIAAQEKVPVLLTTTATLHAEARGFLTTTGTDDVYIAGGTAVVSAAVQAEVDALAGVTVERWYGDNRYLTGAAVVRNAMTTWAIPMVDIGLASGENFPDALAGGAVMGYKHGLLLLTQPNVLSAPTAVLITENKVTIESVEFFGGTGALAPVIPTTVQHLLQ